MDHPTFMEDFAKAIGLQPGEKIEIITPQFERTDSVQVPQSVDFSDWESLPTMSKETLQELGLGIWNADNEKTHWLFPKEWYSIIPNGLMVTCIDGDQESFERGVTDDDYRFGMLSFGFVQEHVKGIV
jgi:hypothetical protein